MSVAGTANAPTVAAPRISAEKLRLALLWLMGFSSALVFIEPSPYEFVAAAAMFVFALSGLALRPALAPFVLLLVVMNVGYGLGLLQVIAEPKAVTWVLISAFLAATGIFYAAMLGTHTQARLGWLLRGYLAAAVIASLAAIGGYFHLLGSWSDAFLIYDRARATFNDPNVLGAFLVLPGLLAFQRVLEGRLTTVIGSGLLLLVMLAALLLTFSRAAWGQFAFSALLLMAMTFITSRSPRERFRILLIAIAGVMVALGLFAALLSIDKVADLFKQRATLEQSYDIGHYGRFGRYLLGAELALDRPFGIGPLQFARFFWEDTHNSYLNSFMAGGWLSGFTYLTLAAVTVVAGLRFVFVATPWRATYLVVYAAYLGAAAESLVIDSDHWRHYFLILGALWGLMAVSRSYRPVALQVQQFEALQAWRRQPLRP